MSEITAINTNQKDKQGEFFIRPWYFGCHSDINTPPSRKGNSQNDYRLMAGM